MWEEKGPTWGLVSGLRGGNQKKNLGGRRAQG